MNIEELKKIKECAKKYYSVKKYLHAMSVEEYCEQDTRYALMSISEKTLVQAIAVAHDLIEDTKCSWSELKECFESEEEYRQFYVAVDLLTHKHEDSYDDYIDIIIKSKNLYAIMVKQADMKDHICRASTLTKKLKEKYEPVIPRLIRA